jgi:hypothetical protein
VKNGALLAVVNMEESAMSLEQYCSSDLKAWMDRIKSSCQVLAFISIYNKNKINIVIDDMYTQCVHIWFYLNQYSFL